MKTHYQIALMICIGLVLLASSATAQDNDYRIDFEALVAEPAPGCAGECSGDDVGSATSTKKCADLTAEETQALKDSACDNADKKDARREANDMCLEQNHTGTCLCLNVTWSDNPGTPADVDGKCTVSCTVSVVGTCKTQLAAEPTEDGTPIFE
jgi:hypothetical protein